MTQEQIQEIRYLVGEAWKGAYNPTTVYGNANVVQDTEGLSVYRSLKPGNSGHPLTDQQWWFKIIDMSSIKALYDQMVEGNNTMAENELERVAAEQSRVSAEQSRVNAENTRIYNENQRINDETTRVRAEQDRVTQENQRISQEQGRVGAEQQRVVKEQQRVNQEASRVAAETQRQLNENDRQAVFAEDHAVAVADHQQAEQDHTRAESDHETAVSDHGQMTDLVERADADHVQAGNDHTRAESDHSTAASDHTQAGQDHTTAAADHTQAGNDHTRAESDHTRAESDHAAVEVYVDSLGVFDLSKHNAEGGVLATYADLSAALTALNALDSKYKYGGMSFKFVQSSDNKYVQYFLPKDIWSIDLNDWLKVDAGLEKFYYINTEQQNGIEYNKYVNENGLLSTTAGFGSNKYEVEPGIYHFKTTMPENRAVSLWAAYKGNELVVKGSLTTVVREETFDLSFYDIDTIYISWTTETKGGAILTKINTAIADNNNKLKNVFTQINDKTPSISTTYSSEKIGDDFVGLVTGKNIFNKDWAVLGAFIDITTNIIREQEGAWYCSEYIEIKPSQSYACNYNTYNNYFIFYDNNKNIISYASASTTSFVTPSNAAFLRITGFNQYQISTFQVEEGSASTPYVPYGKVIPPELLQSSIASFLFVDLKIVDKLGTYGFTSINSAVGAVQDGGVILVMPGEYEESVICQGKEVHIIGFSKDSCILFNTSGDYNNPPLYQTVGSLKNMTVWSKWDSSKDYSEITHFSYAIHIDYYGNNKKYSIENCHLISDFSNTLGCGARPNHCLTIKDCFVEHTNAYKEAFPSASTGGGNCMNMHGGGNETIILRDNVFISKTTDLQFVFGEGNTDVFKLLCVNNAIKTVVGLIAEHFDIQDRSYGNLNASLNYTT